MLTETKLKSLKPRPKTYRIADGHGLSLEIQPGGRRTWVYRFRLHGKQQPIRLGAYPEVTLKEARDRRLEAARLVAQGKSPIVEKRVAKEGLSPRSPVEAFAAVYTSEIVQRDRKDTMQIQRYFRKDILPTIGHIAVCEVTPQQVLTITDRIRNRGALLVALDVRNLLKRMFDYAVARQLTTFNPAAAIPSRTIAVPKARDRALAPEEIRTYLSKLYGSEIGRRYKLALHLILLTLIRKSELTLAQWGHIDAAKGEWHIPAENSKTGKPKVIYLSVQATGLFEQLRATTPT